MFIVFSCLGLLRCTEFVFFLCCLVLLVSTLAPSDWLGRLTLVIFFVSKGFPTKTRLKSYLLQLFHFVYSKHITFSSLSLILNY